MHNLILHIPHSSTVIPFKDGYCVSDEILNQEMLKLTDWYTDDLFANKLDYSVIAPFSRIFCDTERFSDDTQEIMAQFGMGVLYEKTDSGELLRNVTPELRKHIVNEYYWKHHNKLTEIVKMQLEKDSKTIIVDCHSFPNIPFNRDLVKTNKRPDFNIGTDAYHTPQKLVDVSIAFFKSKGYSIGIDQPYAGSIVPSQYYKSNQKVQSIMLEINRNLYLKEPTNEKSDTYLETKKVVQEFLNVIRNA